MKDTKNEPRELILDSAIRIFAEKGYNNTSLRDIGQDCKIYPSMVIYYFSSKEGLLREIIGLIREQIDECAKIISEIRFPNECLSFLIGSTVHWLLESGSLARIFLQELSFSKNKRNDSDLWTILFVHQNLFLKNLNKVMRKGNSSIQTDAQALYHVIFGSIISYWSFCYGDFDAGEKLKNMSVQIERLYLR